MFFTDTFIYLKRILSNASDWLKSLLEKKSCWASCETWKNFKFGIDSTARAEGIHSFIASACNKSMSGSELVATLNSYSTRKDFESEIECERKTYATNFKDCYPKPIKDIYSLTSLFYLERLSASTINYPTTIVTKWRGWCLPG